MSNLISRTRIYLNKPKSEIKNTTDVKTPKVAQKRTTISRTSLFLNQPKKDITKSNNI